MPEDRFKKPSKIQQPIVFDADFSDIPKEVLCSLYRMMLRIRKVQLKIAELYPEDEMKTPVHLCIGQEAVAAGVCANLNPDDYVFSNHRGHGHYIAKGGDIKALIAELYNRETGCSRGRGGSMHLVDSSVGLLGSSSIVGGCIPVATGAALASTLKKNERVSVAFFGDAAVEEGVIYESINFAMLKNLPVIYVCENNFYSVFSHLNKRQASDDIYRRFEGLSIPGYRVDGNNVLDVYRTASRAIHDARRGGGPSFIEARTYRLKDHHGINSGVEVGYRKQKEVDDWVSKCPVQNFGDFLIKQGVMAQRDIDGLNAAIDGEVREAFEFAQTSPLANEKDVLKYLFT